VQDGTCNMRRADQCHPGLLTSTLLELCSSEAKKASMDSPVLFDPPAQQHIVLALVAQSQLQGTRNGA
jgi:hypothetical protein